VQSKLDSFIEAWLNVLIGFGISVLANFVIFPWVGITASTIQVLLVGLFMTGVSVARSYLVRRWANKYLSQVRAKMVEFFRKEVK
jgi:fatty-acid desaturase